MMHVLEHSRSRARALVENPLSSGTKAALAGAGALVVVGGLIYAATRPAAAATPAQQAAAAAQARVVLSMQDGSTLGVGQTHPVTAQLVLGDGTTTDITTQVAWTSSNPAVLSIQPTTAAASSGAVVTPLGPGTAQITALYTRADGSTVLSGPVNVSVIAVAPSGAAVPAITTVLTDATLIRTAQELLVDVVAAKTAAGTPYLVPADGSTIYFTAANVTGTSTTPNDHAFVTALAQVQTILKANDPSQLAGMRTDGLLDYWTLAALVILAALTGSTTYQWLAAGSVSDPNMILVAQGSLAHLIAVGQVSASYTASQVDGSLGTAAFQQALAAFQSKFGPSLGNLPANGQLGWLSWAGLVTFSAAY